LIFWVILSQQGTIHSAHSQNITMPILKYSGSKHKATENFPFHQGQQSEQSVLPPFSGELSVDEKLKLSHENFKQTLDDFFEDINLTPLSQLTATPAFPTPHVLAQFASKAYKDYEKEETDAQLPLPDGWKLLTTASNNSKGNGYFGAAYWHPQNQQVVIAHRGTDPTNLGALWTDLKGVVLNRYVSQMKSASTFAHRVVEILREVNQEKGPVFQVFFTGHSLGGWLAQITTFTMKYLRIEGNTFVKSDTVPHSFHPHTVVFDSPGCKGMLSEMRDTFDVRLDGCSIDLEHLDITSYLSAPNRINTCNKHVGTVYRIFTDLSDMGWWKKHTPLYNLATHSMDKIVEAFDPNTGKVREDEQGKLKVQVVIDWPVSSGLSGGEEYESFFKGAKHLNDYHQEVKDVTFQSEGYHPMRYQTKTYDEGVIRLSVFCQEERQFLESYSWLRQLPEFFKPKELFSVMEDNKVQKQAEETLKSFEIENDKLRCTDSTALQALVPYVKRLLQLFPQIKERTTSALSSGEVRNRVYQIETRRYVERIRQSPLDFKADDLSLRDFVRSDHEQVLKLQMVDGDEWTGLIKVYRVLEKTGCLSECQYTVLKLKRLLSVNQLMDFSTVMLSTRAPHLLLMACDTNELLNDEAKDIIRKTFKTIEQNPNIKIILSTRSEGTTHPSLQQIGRAIFGERFVTRDEQLTWSDLTTSSQEKLLEKSVTFQGTEISLNELMSAESPLAKLLPLGALLEEKQLKIADRVPISNAYNEGYYIGRTLRQHRAVKEEKLTDESKKEFPDLIANTEQEFKQHCQLYPKSNVHWLEKDKSGKLVWQQSQGSLETVHRCIDTESSHSYTADDLDKLLEQAQKQRVMLISDTAGMGKSTVLTHLSKQIKQKFPAKWVVRIDLNDHTDALNALKKEQIDKDKAIEFVSEKVLKHKPGLELELFKQCCEQKQKVRIVIMLDGFDEISPFYKETVIDLLQALRQTVVEQLWVTTRPHLREDLEDKLQQLSYTLQPFSEVNQIEFLTKFWNLKEWVSKMENNEKEENNKKIEIYAKELIKRLVISINDKTRGFAGIPLQTRMLAEAFEKEFKIFFQSPESMPELPSKLDLIGLYGKFIESKYDIYQEEKFQVRKTNVIAKEQRERDLKIMKEDYQLLALKVLFNEENVALFQDNRQCTFSAKHFSRIGIVQVSHDGKPHFIHRTFAEYYVAEYLVDRLTDGNKISQQVLTFILKEILLEEDRRAIRVFLDDLLSRCRPLKEALKEYGNEVHGMGKYATEVFKKALSEGNSNIVGLLLDCVQAADHTDTLNEMLLARYQVSNTAWHNAIFLTHTHILDKLLEWVKENLTAEEINNKLLLARNRNEMTVWHVAAEWDKPEILQKLWDMAEEKLTTEEIKNKLLLSTDTTGRTILHLAADNVKSEILQKVWEWAKQKLTTEEIRNKLLLATDNGGHTVWHYASAYGKPEKLQKLWECAKEKLTTEEINNKLLLATNYRDTTVWHVAAESDNPEILQKIWERAVEDLTTEEINNKLLLATDNWGRTVWHVAAQRGNLEILQKVWEWAKLKLTTDEINNKLLLATDGEGRTVWHVAVAEGKPETFQKVWECAKEKLTTEEIKNKLLLARDNKRRTVWHEAARKAKPELLQKLWEWAKEKLTAEEIKNKLLLATDYEGSTIWHMAVESFELGILEEVWECAKEKLTTVEINNKLLATDNKGRTVWHVAAEKGYRENLQKVWEWAKEKLTTEEINNKLLLATDGEGRTVCHVAAEKREPEILQKVWEWSKEKLTTEEINNKLLLATDCEGRTVWHVAAKNCVTKVFQQLLKLSTEKLTTEELNNKMLLATDGKGRTVLHVLAESGKQEILQELRDWAEEARITEDMYKKLLLATDNKGRSICHFAGKSYNVMTLQIIWDWARKKLTTEEINNKLLASDYKGRTVLHVIAKWGSPEIIQELRVWADEEGITEMYNKLLLAPDRNKMTVWHMAITWGQPEMLQKLWETAEEKLTTEEIKNKLLLSTEPMGMTVLHLVTKRTLSEIRVLQKVWEWAKEKLTTEEIRNRLLLATDNWGRTVWHVAAERGNPELLQKLCECAKEKLTTVEINNKLLLATNYKNMTVWHVAAHRDNPELLQKVWERAEKELTTEEINNKLLLATDNEGSTVWHVAARWGNPEILQKVWEWAKEKLTTEEINNKLLLATDGEERTVWHVAVAWGKREIFYIVWECAKDKLTTEEIKNKLLLARDNKRRTVWHEVARSGGRNLLQKLWEWAKENLTTEEIKNKLLLATDYEGSTVWHMAVERGSLEISEKVWECAKEQLTTAEIYNKLLATDNKGRTVWHVAANKGQPEILQILWEWAKEKLTTAEMNNKLLATDNKGRTVWHVAAKRGQPEILQKVWEWSEEKLTTEEINNKLLLATDCEGRTVWHVAAEKCKTKVLQELWKWSTEKLTTEELNNKLLLATDGEGRTVLHVLAESGKPEILQELRDWAEEARITEDMYNKLLLATDNKGRTICHFAAESCNLMTLQIIWEWARKKLTTEEINKKLLATDYEGRTVLHVIAKWGTPEILQELRDWAKR